MPCLCSYRYGAVVMEESGFSACSRVLMQRTMRRCSSSMSRITYWSTCSCVLPSTSSVFRSLSSTSVRPSHTKAFRCTCRTLQSFGTRSTCQRTSTDSTSTCCVRRRRSSSTWKKCCRMNARRSTTHTYSSSSATTSRG